MWDNDSSAPLYSLTIAAIEAYFSKSKCAFYFIIKLPALRELGLSAVGLYGSREWGVDGRRAIGKLSDVMDAPCDMIEQCTMGYTLVQ